MSSDQVLNWNKEGLLAEVLGYETNEVAREAVGATITTYSGARYLDFTSGIAVHALGHTSPDVVRAIQEQASRVIHTSDIMRHAPQLALASRLRERIAERIPGEPWTVQFLNSGSESVDAAAKLALKATGRSKFIAFKGAFHGRTLFATALSLSNNKHRQAYEPFLRAFEPNILRAPAPRPHSGSAAGAPTCADGVESLVEEHGDGIAAIFFEPQQGEGGFFPMPVEDARRIREIASSNRILLIADEIQTGFGRTGRWFGFEHLGIAPDILVFGKAIGGGLPLAGLTAPASLIGKWEPGEHGTTFGGNPIACAAGLAAVQGIEAGRLVEHADAAGQAARERLGALVGHYGVVDVRGNGLMIGIEVRASDGAPDYARVAEVKARCRENGLLVLTCGARIGDPAVDNSTLRLLPPLNISDAELSCGLDVLIAALEATGVA